MEAKDENIEDWGDESTSNEATSSIIKTPKKLLMNTIFLD
jgi:hypothetical protein